MPPDRGGTAILGIKGVGQWAAMLETRGIVKDFGGTRALDRVDFSVRSGEVHALVGENGAGKSTLMKIISGALQPDSGTIRLSGSRISVDNPHHALRLGISIVHQHSGLVPRLTVGENIFLGRMPRTRPRTRQLEAAVSRRDSAAPATRLQVGRPPARRRLGCR